MCERDKYSCTSSKRQCRRIIASNPGRSPEYRICCLSIGRCPSLKDSVPSGNVIRLSLSPHMPRPASPKEGAFGKEHLHRAKPFPYMSPSPLGMSASERAIALKGWVCRRQTILPIKALSLRYFGPHSQIHLIPEIRGLFRNFASLTTHYLIKSLKSNESECTIKKSPAAAPSPSSLTPMQARRRSPKSSCCLAAPFR